MSDLNLSPAALAKANDLLLLLMDGSFHRGEELAEALAISKSAVSKRAQKLLSLDLPLSAVKGRGYRLQNAQQWLQFPLLQTKLSDLDCALSYQPLVDSTNAVLKQRGRLAATELLVCDWQSAGRGRRGRQWHSRAGENLLFSYRMPIRDNSMLSWLSLSVAWHLVAVLQSRGVKALSVKWPNDIYLDGQKLAGILVELVGNLENGFEAVIGVGMNVHNLVDQRIDQSYSSLSLHGLELDKTSLLADIVRAFYQKLWLNFEQPSAEQWQQIDYLSEKSVELVVGDRRIQGQARGVNEEGQLLIEIDGQLNSFNGGEVSVRAKQ